jgi:methylase of polypeptide subunit release factors
MSPASQMPTLEILKKACSGGYEVRQGNDSMLSLFHELGFAIIKSNLALKHPYFPSEAIKRQYERMLGTKIGERFDLAVNSIVDPCEFDVLGRIYEDAAHANGTRKGAGEFYTPPFVADYMIRLLELEKDQGLPDRKFIDIACGTGAFLMAGMREVIRILSSRGTVDKATLQRAVGSLHGLDISPTACDICKINLYIVLLNELGPEAMTGMGRVGFNVFNANSIDNNAKGEADGAARIKSRLGVYRNGFDYVLGNPPYLEAKKMPAALKSVCRESWPGAIDGAFDLYIPFILQCNRLVAEEGKVCLILPDKFTVARYALRLREKLASDYSLIELADLSAMDVFDRAMVYPIVLSYENRPPVRRHAVKTRMSVLSPEELAENGRTVTVPQDLYRSIGHNCTFFCLPEDGDIAGMLRRIFEQGKPIGNYVTFRSAVSFHKKGLRERFVRQSFNGEKGPVLKYLGGRSYAKRNEVGLFRFGWEGYYINYDQARLKEFNNMLPPLSNFTQEKIVLCQHAPRITAAYDEKGEYVTKDVYPVGIAAQGPGESPLSLRYFTVLLNSELMSFVYGTVYKGIQIGGGYYHYLPTWLDILPVIVPEKKEIKKAEHIADSVIKASGRAAKLRLMREADGIFYRVYGVSHEQQAIISKTVPPWHEKIS